MKEMSQVNNQEITRIQVVVYTSTAGGIHHHPWHQPLTTPNMTVIRSDLSRQLQDPDLHLIHSIPLYYI